MKRILIFLVILSMMFVSSGCGKEQPAEPSVPELTFDEKLAASSVMDVIEFGNYNLDDYGETEPIPWYVLENSNNRLLLISKYLIKLLDFDDTRTLTWEDSLVRKELNEDFYNAAFSEEEKERIVVSTVTNCIRSRYEVKETHADTKDKLFLPNVDDIESFFIPNPAYHYGKAAPISYCLRDIGYDEYETLESWKYGLLLEHYNGFFTEDSHTARQDDIGLRPMMRIKYNVEN